MAGLEGKLGALISSVEHLTDSVEGLKRGVQADHDKLIGLESAQSEWKRTLFNRLDQAETAVIQAKAAANEAKLFAEKLVDDLKMEMAKGVEVKGDRWFQVLMAMGGVVLSLVTAWMMLRFGLKG